MQYNQLPFQTTGHCERVLSHCCWAEKLPTFLIIQQVWCELKNVAYSLHDYPHGLGGVLSLLGGFRNVFSTTPCIIRQMNQQPSSLEHRHEATLGGNTLRSNCSSEVRGPDHRGQDGWHWPWTILRRAVRPLLWVNFLLHWPITSVLFLNQYLSSVNGYPHPVYTHLY